MKTLLINGKIFGGTSRDAFVGDILIENEKILQVGKVEKTDDMTVIDLQGKSISFGFIDALSHNDWFAIKREPQKYFEPFLRQGITSFVADNCGL